LLDGNGVECYNPLRIREMGIKIWLDDTREAPSGWIRAYWPEEVFQLAQNYEVDTISLDHDLGNDKHGTGYDVLTTIEEMVVVNKMTSIPEIKIHTANPAARKRMEMALESIQLRVEEYKIEKELKEKE
jgi:hypothetical protein